MSEGFAERVIEMATRVGFAHQVLEGGEAVRLVVAVEGAGEVPVFVRPCGEMLGKEVLEFSSAGLTLPSDDAAKMPLLILALQRNADVMLGHWGLDEAEEGSTLRVFHSQITETMDQPELRGAVLGVADEYATVAGAFEELIVRGSA